MPGRCRWNGAQATPCGRETSNCRMRSKVVLKSIVIAAALAVTAPAAEAQVPRISWSIAPEGRGDGSEFQLTIESSWAPGSHSIWSNTRNISELPGLTAAQLRGAPQPARFALIRDAGRLDCS